MRLDKSNIKQRIPMGILFFYILILILGSLHPIFSWQWPKHGNWLASFERETRYTPLNDLIINFLIYVPLGMLVAYIQRKKLKNWLLFFLIWLRLSALSLSIEFFQVFIPSRAQSFIDFGMNSLGAGTGVLP